MDKDKCITKLNIAVELDDTDVKKKLNEIEEQVDRITSKYKRLEQYQQGKNSTPDK